MSRKVITTLVDDINGTPIEESQGETVMFALDGVNYEIDLNDENAAKLRTVLDEYTEKGRRVGRTTTGKAAPRRSSGAGPKEDLSAARAWLRANGHEVSERGRIAASLLEEYRANN
ncbi:Lsr2 family protein [Clavibacter michiganensis]|nr:Lsr2 family protein [Clavibacter michiganensis]